MGCLFLKELNQRFGFIVENLYSFSVKDCNTHISHVSFINSMRVYVTFESPRCDGRRYFKGLPHFKINFRSIDYTYTTQSVYLVQMTKGYAILSLLGRKQMDQQIGCNLCVSLYSHLRL